MKAFIIAALLMIAGFAQAGGGFANQFSGSWRGVGVQDGADSWVILLEIGALETRAEYPDIPCAAIWKFGLELGHSVSAVEQLTHGESLCADDSLLVIEGPSESQLIVIWSDPSGVEIGFAVLHPNDPAQNDREREQAESTFTRMSRNLGLRGNPACLPATS